MSYLDDQKASMFKVGDTVVVLRTATNHENGWGTIWLSHIMDQTVGKTFTIFKDCDSNGFQFEDGGAAYPYFILQLVYKYPSYIDRHKASGLKVGDKVKVLRTANDQEDGWHNSWTTYMDKAVGNIYKIVDDNGKDGFELNLGNRCFPYFVLELQPATQPAFSGVQITGVYPTPTGTPALKPCVKSEWYPAANTCNVEAATNPNYPHKCPICGAPAYIGFNKTECSKGCR